MRPARAQYLAFGQFECLVDQRSKPSPGGVGISETKASLEGVEAGACLVGGHLAWREPKGVAEDRLFGPLLGDTCEPGRIPPLPGRGAEDGRGREALDRIDFGVDQGSSQAGLGFAERHRLTRVLLRRTDVGADAGARSRDQESRRPVFSLVHSGVGSRPHDPEPGAGHSRIGQSHLFLELEEMLSWGIGRAI